MLGLVEKHQIVRPVTDVVLSWIRVFGPFLPIVISFSRLRQYQFLIIRRTPMGSKLYVGGLPYSATEAQLNDVFAAHGTVESARVITDKFTGQSRGFGFVEMATAEEANAAIAALNGTQMDGRTLTVNEAKPQEPRSGGGGGGGGRFGGGGGGGGRDSGRRSRF
jgi:RNA recognition motif-containing protein